MNKWLIGLALPLWIECGVDWKRGGFFDSINIHDLKSPADFKRLRVLARQIYVFSYGCSIGQTYCMPAVVHGLTFLLERAQLETGGYASRFNADGEIIDESLDLYDLSFCLFAFAHGYKLLRDHQLLMAATSLADFISARFRHASGGFIEGLPLIQPRRQNPHMHLLEALIEWRSLSDHSIFIELSDEVICLFFNKFFFPGEGILIEYYDDELIPLPHQKGQVTEPGHHYEWMWLLKQYQSISPNQIPPHSSLYTFANAYGRSSHNGMLWGEVSKFGQPLAPLVRLWPHTEWLKAEIVNEDRNDKGERALSAWKALKRFLECPQPGLWFETFDHEKNSFIAGPAPASSFYHIVLAIEVLNRACKS